MITGITLIKDRDTQFNKELEAALGKRECIFKGALDLCEERGGQAPKSFNQTSLVDGFDLFGHGFGSKGEAGNPLGDHRVTGGEVGCVFGQRDDHYKLAESIDAVVGENNHRSSLFNFDADGGVKIGDDNITPLYGDHLPPPFQGLPMPHRRLAPLNLKSKISNLKSKII